MDDARGDSSRMTGLEEKMEPIRKHAACEMINSRTFDVVSTECFVAGGLMPLLVRLVVLCRSMVKSLGREQFRVRILVSFLANLYHSIVVPLHRKFFKK